MESSLLDGHLSLTVELLAFRSVSERYQIGSHPEGQQFIKVCVMLCNVEAAMCLICVCSPQKLVLDFLFPASRLVREARTNPGQ